MLRTRRRQHCGRIHRFLGAALAVLTVAGVSASATLASVDARVATTPTSLTVAIGAEPGNLDVLLFSDGPRDLFVRSVMEGLTARQGAKIVPALATSWKLQRKEWVFQLRRNVRFHNGKIMDSADVVASYRRLLDPKNASQILGNSVTSDTTVRAIGKWAVGIGRLENDPTLVPRTSLVMITERTWAATGDTRMKNSIVGTGPYSFVSWQKGQRILLKAFPRYWGKKPPIKQVTIKFSAEPSSRFAALRAGEIQMALNMPPDLAGQAPKVYKVPQSEVLMARMNAKFGPFKDSRVRLAANYAIDRQAIRAQLYKGFASSARGQQVASGVFGYDPALRDYQYNPTQARQLLEEAGAVGAQIKMVATTGRWANDREVAQVMAGMLEKVGFKVTLELPVFSEWVAQVFIAQTAPEKAPDIMPYNHSNQLFDASTTLNQNLSCKGRASLVCYPAVDELLNRALGELNPKKRATLYSQAWRILQANSAFISIGEVRGSVFAAKNVNWVLPIDGFLRFQDMSFKA